MANQNGQLDANVGKCVDFNEGRWNDGQWVNEPKQGWKITGIFANALRMGDDRYIVVSNAGAGPEQTVIFPNNVTDMYDCPPEQNNNSNVEMIQGGRRRRRHGRKTHKKRKAAKRTRRH